jgi:RNA polymerase sigma-70 factor (ECF subfamily)
VGFRGPPPGESEYKPPFRSLSTSTMGQAPQSSPTSAGFDPARLVQEHQAGVWRYLRALGCDPAQADDLAQETFLAVFQKPFHDFNASATSAYLRKVAYNLFITHHRRSGRVIAMENLEEIDQTWSRWAGEDNGEEMLGALKACLEHLTPRARMALEMRFRDKASRESIATALAIGEHGAKNLMQRAKHQLRTCIESKLGPEVGQ